MHIACPLWSAAREDANLPAIETPDDTLSYADLDALVSGTARRLRERDPGTRIALLLPNDWRTLVLILATVRAGRTACMLSTRLPPAAVQALRRRVGADLLVTGRQAGGAAAPDELIRRGEVEVDPIRSDDPATVVFTSGSTGAARAALHSYGNHYFSAVGSNENIAVGPGDRWLLSLPLYHVGGLAILFRCLLGRATVVVPDPEEPFAASVRGVTHVSMVATQLRRYLRAGTSSHLKALLLGGSAIPHGLLERANSEGLPVHTSYGSTEMASQIAATPPNAPLDVLETSGRLLAHRELRIDGQGQILVRGRTRFLGYVEGDTVEKPFDDGGWFATRDLGHLDARGLLHVLGRMDNMFISGGENVIPEEIESALCTVGQIVRAVVVPVDDPDFGHRPVAFVDTGDATVSDETLREAVERLLPRFMIPVRFFPWPDESPAAGVKTDRQKMRRIAAKRYARG